MGLQAALVVGPERRINQIKHRLDTYPEAGLRFESSYTPFPGNESTAEFGRTLVNTLLAEHDVDHVICVPDQVEEVVFLDFVRFSKGQVDVSLVLPVATLSVGRVRSSIGDLGVIPLRLRPSWGSAFAKRSIDVVGASVMLALLSPILILTAAAIWLSDRGPILFRQCRVGRDGNPFIILKFRSMIEGAEFLQTSYAPQNVVKRGLLFKLDGDPRITPIGSVIRRFSIDELPQLINVLRGEMSLVGPRPLAVQPDQFDLRAHIRHQTSPGVTGLWQALGANALDYEDMLNLDLAYVTSRTLGVDLLTLLRTVPALINRRAPY
jgi:lipopolysaccharide/colanic/teichoic acid biosynthesis glycosyltransferase